MGLAIMAPLCGAIPAPVSLWALQFLHSPASFTPSLLLPLWHHSQECSQQICAQSLTCYSLFPGEPAHLNARQAPFCCLAFDLWLWLVVWLVIFDWAFDIVRKIVWTLEVFVFLQRIYCYSWWVAGQPRSVSLLRSLKIQSRTKLTWSVSLCRLTS